MQVINRMQHASQRSGRSTLPRLVAVSKTKPVSAIQEAYDAGHRDFGENYVQEMVEKAPQLPPDIRWRFIGHLQSNKAKALIHGVPSLAAIETVDSEKLASKLNAAVESLENTRLPLAVFVQVNTSGEESKHGVQPGQECVSLSRFIHDSCPHLQLAGLMTIGMPDYSSRPENFSCLDACRAEVADALQLDKESLELSMGMSGDFENAIEMGSTNIRVGSTIFGARQYNTAL